MAITSINQLDPTKIYSYADYLTWVFQDRLELLKGKVALMSPAPNSGHQQISMNLTRPMVNYFYKSTCQLFAAPFDVRLPQNGENEDSKIYTVVQPDLCVICDSSKIDDRGCLGAPDMVVEILSPGNTQREMNEKFSLYESAGVKEYWIVTPMTESVLVYELSTEGVFIGKKPLTSAEILTTPLFPGLSISLEEVFAIPPGMN
ncbi:MAG: Uma2 family endonuclease [Bacteroidota bacterium]